jgi:hypothetical protein
MDPYCVLIVTRSAPAYTLHNWLQLCNLGNHVQPCGFQCAQVGMQSSALAAVLAKIHFPDQPMAVAACIMSACTHATLGSLLAGFWNAMVQNPDA